jgi:hypothetical protein
MAAAVTMGASAETGVVVFIVVAAWCAMRTWFEEVVIKDGGSGAGARDVKTRDVFD